MNSAYAPTVHQQGSLGFLVKTTIENAIAHVKAQRLAEAQQTVSLLDSFSLGEIPCTLVGLILLTAKAETKALGWFDRALASNPASYYALSNRALALQELGRLEEALVAFDAALRCDASDPTLYYNRGNVLRKLGRPEEAIASYDEALLRRPAYPEVLLAGGELLQESGCLDAALAFYDDALRHDPRLFQAWFKKGFVLQTQGRSEAALAAFEAARALHPTNADVLSNLGVSLYHMGRFGEALTAHNAAIGVRPVFAEGLSNRGNAFMMLGRPEEGLADYEAALRLKPDHLEALSNRAMALQELGRLDEAAAAFELAVRPGKSAASVKKSQAMLQLLRGDFERGWAGYELRWISGLTLEQQSKLGIPVWPGPAAGFGRILVLDEQGHGDAIHFARFLVLLAEQGADVTFVCRDHLHRLLGQINAPVRVLRDLPANESFDHQIALASLPKAFGVSADTIPAPVPYLRAEPALVAKWAARIGTHGLRVGLCWQGNATDVTHLARSIPLARLAGLAEIEGVRLISLQRRDGLEQIAQLPQGVRLETFDEADAGPDAFIDTAAMMANLDLIITVDTAVAHLAGALGRPVWTLLKKNPDWRWFLDREDSPWYPSMRLFRQARHGDWDGLMDEVARSLHACMHSADIATLPRMAAPEIEAASSRRGSRR